MSLFVIVVGAVIYLFAILVVREFWLYRKVEYQVYKKFPGPKNHLFFGTLSNLIFKNQVQTFEAAQVWFKRFKTTYSLWWNGYLVLNVLVAKDVEQIFTSSKCLNKSFIYDYLQPFMGTGLVTSAHQKWQNRRKILTPTFHFNILRQFHEIFKNQTDHLIQTIKNNENNVINLKECMAQYTLKTLCETTMGIKLTSADETNRYLREIRKIVAMVAYRLTRPWLISQLLCTVTGYSKKFAEIISPAHNFTRQIIKERRQKFQAQHNQIPIDGSENIYESKKPQHAMLDTLLCAEARGDIDSAGIHEEVDTFMFAGHDTISTALTFTLFLLAENSDIQQKLYEEIRDFSNIQNMNRRDINDLNQLKYLDRVLKESLRIYPPTAFIVRTVSEKLQFNDVVLPVDTMIFVHIFNLHREESQFPDPEKFDPDRFLQHEIEKRLPYSYIPFSAGPRNCIGRKFALLQLKTLLVELILNFHLEQVTKRDELIFMSHLGLKTKNPIKVKFNLRQ